MCLNLFAQDLIIKNDQTEVKSKVIELTDDTIKYKKYDMLDGPIYSIKNSEVFMIAYKNGTKEYISQKTNPSAVVVPQTATGNFTNPQLAPIPVDLKFNSKTTDNTKTKSKSIIALPSVNYFVVTPTDSNLFSLGCEFVFWDELCIGPKFTMGEIAGEFIDPDTGIAVSEKFEFGDNFYAYAGITYSITTSRLLFTPRIDWYFMGDFGVNALLYHDSISAGLVYRLR